MDVISVCFKKDEAPVKAIMAFRGPYRFLSNFHEEEVWLPEETVEDRFGNLFSLPRMAFDTNEHAYMAWKMPYLPERLRIQGMQKGSEVKRWSQRPEFRITHRKDYTEEGRVRIFLNLCRQKFDPHTKPYMAEVLVKTDSATLIEGTTWYDNFCGVDMTTGAGQNYLGRILMTVRDEVRSAWGLEPLQPQGYYLPDWAFA